MLSKLKSFIFVEKVDETFASSLITAGLGFVKSSFGDDLLCKAVMLLQSKNVDESLSIMENLSQTNWVQLAVGMIFLWMGIYFWFHIRHRLYILNINGYFPPVRIEDHYSSLNLNRFAFKEQEIDIIHERIDEIDEEKAKYILDLLKRKVNSFIEQSRDCQKGYTGIAPIPFIAIAGTWLKKTKFDRYFEYDRKNAETYYELSRSNKFPELKDLTDYNKLNKNATEVVVAVSTTARIEDWHLKQFNCEVVRLSVDNPNDNTIRSHKQLIDYKNKISEVIDKLSTNLPNLRRIHLVCATQSNLVLEIGKCIEENRHVPIIAYHFNNYTGQKQNVYYPWGIVLNGMEKGKFVKVV